MEKSGGERMDRREPPSPPEARLLGCVGGALSLDRSAAVAGVLLEVLADPVDGVVVVPGTFAFTVFDGTPPKAAREVAL
jgi:hypothetical protein